MKLIDLCERTMNDERLYEWIKQWAGKGFYTHVSPDQYLRTNVKSMHDSPAGIYGYNLDKKLKAAGNDPAQVMKELTDTGSQMARNYINVLQPTPSRLLDLGNYSDQQFQHDLDKLLQHIVELAKTTYKGDLGQIFRRIQIKDVSQITPDHVREDLVRLWKSTEEGQQWISDPKNIVDIVTNLVPRLAKKESSRDVMSRHIFLNLLGYDVIKDPENESRIFQDEPEPDQIVFLTQKSYKVVDMQPLSPPTVP